MTWRVWTKFLILIVRWLDPEQEWAWSILEQGFSETWREILHLAIEGYIYDSLFYFRVLFLLFFVNWDLYNVMIEIVLKYLIRH